MRGEFYGLAVLLLLAVTAHPACAAGQDEASLRAADQQQAEAARNRDAAALEAMMHAQFMVNSPEGEVWPREKVISMWRTRGIGHDRFDRTIEKIQITNDVGVVMGREIVQPSVDSVAGQRRSDGGKAVERRFTNIWVWQQDRWWFYARHANEKAGG